VTPLVAVAAGCGGGGSQLSADEYRTQADKICREADKKLEALGEPESLEEFKQLMKDAQPTVEQTVEDLGELEPPDDLQDAHERWMEKNEALVETTKELQEVENEQELERLGEEFGEEGDEADQIARDELGLDDCGDDV
jgi:hypothetical protein